MRINNTRNVVSKIDGLESQEMGMVTTKKSFRVVLDGIYEHKIPTVVREIWSNASDSHKAAGIADIPFECHMPTPTDPTFWVRDSGIGMSHDMAMNLYTKLFWSDKDDSDEFTGQLGIGSKSVYAYTDSFEVTIWIEGEKRVYLAALNEEELPTFTHVSSTPSSESRGLKVSFPVQGKDIPAFKEAAELIAIAFDVPPKCTGQALDIPKPVYQGDGWAIYNKDSRSPLLSGDSIRQGCVRYPVNIGDRFTSFSHVLTADVPIGSVQVAANRESLSLDDATSKNVTLAFQHAHRKVHEQMARDLAACTSRIEAEKLKLKFDSILYRCPNMSWRGINIRGYVELDDPPRIRKEKKGGNLYEPGTKPNFSVASLGRSHFIIDFSDDKTRAKRKRMREFRKALPNSQEDYCYIVSDPTPAQLIALGRDLGLRPEQIVTIDSLPEVEDDDVKTSAKIPARGTGSRSGIYQTSKSSFALTKITDDEVDENGYWMTIESITPSVEVDFLGMKHRLDHLTRQVYAVMAHLSIPDQPIYFLMARATKRLDMPKEQELGHVITEAIKASKVDLLKDQRDEIVHSALRRDMTPAASKSASTFHALSGGLNRDVVPRHPKLNHPFIRKMLEGDFAANTTKVNKSLSDLRTKYPLFFQTAATETDLKDYFAWRNGTSSTPAPTTP